jgi:lipopolysaccharide cholinephosphotransferase
MDNNLRALQLRILDILLVFDALCKEHNLRYYTIAGTMLGAVRHKGFIPWDDDLDVGMPRKDYDLLMAHAKQWLPQRYEFVCMENNSQYPYFFAKIQDANTTLVQRMHREYVGGIYLDIFPLDGYPKHKIVQRIHFTRFKLWTRVLYFTSRDPYKHGKGPGSWLPLLCRKLFTPESVKKSIRNTMAHHDFDKSAFVIDHDNELRGIMRKEIFGNPTPISFEGHTLYGVENQDVYLRKTYGDYMQIPEESERIQHPFLFLDLEKPYREYKNDLFCLVP